MCIIINKNLQEKSIELIILTAIREMMLAKIPKDIYLSIENKLRIEKEELLRNFN